MQRDTRGSRLARVRARFTSLADVGLALRVFGWALILPLLKHIVPVTRLAALMHRSPSRSLSPSRALSSSALKSSNHQIVQSPNSKFLVDRVVCFSRWGARLVRWNSGGNCLERGLIAYRYLGAAGANPTLVVGLSRADGGVIGHAWVLVDGKPVGETEAAISVYTPVFAFAPDGSIRNVEVGNASS